jgi:uncharacterized repeat protein (TIGR02543 family)
LGGLQLGQSVKPAFADSSGGSSPITQKQFTIGRGSYAVEGDYTSAYTPYTADKNTTDFQKPSQAFAAARKLAQDNPQAKYQFAFVIFRNYVFKNGAAWNNLMTSQGEALADTSDETSGATAFDLTDLNGYSIIFSDASQKSPHYLSGGTIYQGAVQNGPSSEASSYPSGSNDPKDLKVNPVANKGVQLFKLAPAANTQVTFQESTLRNGYSESGGGLIDVSGAGELGLVKGVKLRDSIACDSPNDPDDYAKGGAVYAHGEVTLTIADVATLSHNVALQRAANADAYATGGSINLGTFGSAPDSTTLNMVGGVVSDSVAITPDGLDEREFGIGGGIFVYTKKATDLKDATIVNNRAAAGGGMAISKGNGLTLAGPVFKGNLATGYGGGLSTSDQPITINKAEFNANVCSNPTARDTQNDPDDPNLKGGAIAVANSGGSSSGKYPLASFSIPKGADVSFKDNSASYAVDPSDPQSISLLPPADLSKISIDADAVKSLSLDRSFFADATQYASLLALNHFDISFYASQNDLSGPYPQWFSDRFAPMTLRTVTFEPQGGSVSGTATRHIRDGYQLGELPKATRKGYALIGWFDATTGGSQASPATTISSNRTYYARWKECETYSIGWNATDAKKAGYDANYDTPQTALAKATDTKKVYSLILYRDFVFANSTAWKAVADPAGTYSGAQTSTLQIPVGIQVALTSEPGKQHSLSGGTLYYENAAASGTKTTDATFFGGLDPANPTANAFEHGATLYANQVADAGTLVIKNYGKLSLSNLIIRNGDSGPNASGPALVENKTASTEFNTDGGTILRDGFGNAVYSAESRIQIEGTTITSNVARWGGALCLIRGTAAVKQSKLSANIAIASGSSRGLGGAIYALAPELTLDEVEISNNKVDAVAGSSAAVDGAGIYWKTENNGNGPIGKLVASQTANLRFSGNWVEQASDPTNNIAIKYGAHDLEIYLEPQSVKNITPCLTAFAGQALANEVSVFNNHDIAATASAYTDGTENDPRHQLSVVHFNPAGGTLVGSDRAIVRYGDPLSTVISALPSAKRSGYDFLGWKNATDGALVDLNQSMTNSVDLFAQWKQTTLPPDHQKPDQPVKPDTPDKPNRPDTHDPKKKTYKVDFREGKGSKVKDLRVSRNKRIGKLPKSYRNGYLLKGWYTKQQGGKKVTTKTKVERNLTLYAQWKKLKRVKTIQVAGCFTVTVRKSGHMGTRPLAYLKVGRKVDILRKANKRGWVKVKYGKTTGFIYKKYLKLR